MSYNHNGNIFIPFYIFHYIDTKANIHYGFIGNSQKIKINSIWKFYGLFYAMLPKIPIPISLRLIRAKNSYKFPYNTEKVEYVYDPFDVQPNTVSFITWSKVVPDTVPLYLYITPEGGSYPSFESKPPQTDGWDVDIISPLYVLVDNRKQSKYQRDKYNRPIFTFTSYDGRCLPNPYGISFSDCLIKNNQFNPTLLEQLEQLKQASDNNKLDIKTVNPIILIIFTVLFIISLIVCIICLI
jgi:hypothetical protein